jgi:hypothetical protein
VAHLGKCASFTASEASQAVATKAPQNSRLGTILHIRVATPLSVTLRKSRKGIRALAKYTYDFHVECQIKMKRLLTQIGKGMKKLALVTRQYVWTLSRFSTNKLQRALRALIDSSLARMHVIQNQWDKQRAKVSGMNQVSPSDGSKSSSTAIVAPRSSTTWLPFSSSKRSDTPVVTISSVGSSRTPLITKERRQKTAPRNTVTMEQLASTNRVDSIDDNTRTDVQTTIPSPTLLGRLSSKLLTGLLFVAGGVMIGYLWNDWLGDADPTNRRQQPSRKMNAELVDGDAIMTDDDTMAVNSLTGVIILEQDIFYSETEATATSIVNPVTPEAVRY